MQNKILIILLAGMMTIISCDDCFDCDLNISQPYVSLVFINADSLSQLDTRLSQIETLRDSTNNLVDSLETITSSLTDSLLVIQVGLDTGNFTYQEVAESIQLTLQQDSIQLAESELVLAVLTEETSEINAIQSTINSGRVSISQIKNLQNDSLIIATDSSEIYNIPLSISLDSTRLGFIIAEEEYDLGLTYTRSIGEDLKTNVIVSSQGISETTYSFDSVKVDCTNTLCNANETTVTCYF